MTRISEILQSDSVYRLGWALLHSLWQIALLGSMMAVLLAVLRCRSASLRYLAACAGLAAMFVLPVVTYCIVPERPGAEGAAVAMPPGKPQAGSADAVSPKGEPQRAALSNAEPPEITPGTPRPAKAPIPAPPQPSPPAETATPLPEQVSRAISPWLPWLVMGWFAGVFLLSVWHLGGWIAMQRLKRLGTAPSSEHWAERVADLMQRMKLSRPVRMLQSAIVDAPAVVGWLRPVILAPPAMLSEMSPQQIDAVLAHELAHIRRYDYLANLFQTAIETLLFYHPAVWWLSGRVRIEREHCCDDAAVAVCGSKLDYAEALKAVEQARAAPRLAVAATGADDAGTPLGRVRRVLGLSTPDSLWSRSWLGGSGAVLLVIALMLGYMATAGEPQGEFGKGDNADSAAQRGFDGAQQRQLQQLWGRIGRADPQAAHEAMQAMAAEGDSCVAFLRRQIQPVLAKANQEDLQQLIAELDDDRFDVRQQAHREIGLLGPWAVPCLRAALPRAESAEQQHRLTKLIRAAESPVPITLPRRQMIRAVEVLGLIETDEARTLLKQIESSPAKPRARYVPSPVWAVLLPRSPIRSLEDYHHVIRTDPAPRPPLYKPLPVPECDLEIRRAEDQARVARIPYKGYFHDNGELSKSGRRRIGQLPDGKYLVALCIGNGRCSNVAAFEVDSAYDPAKERPLRLEAIEVEPWQTLRYLGVRGTGPTPRDPKFTTVYVHCPVLTVDGATRALDEIKGSFQALPPGRQFDSLVDLSGYGLPVKLDKPRTIKAHSGQYESNTVRISSQRPLGEAWDQATPGLPAVPPPTVVLRGKVIGPDGKRAKEYEVSLSQMDGTSFREKSDAVGHYEFVNIPAGTYELACNPAGMGQPVLVIRDFRIEGGKTRVQDLSLRQKFIISGNVTDPDGRPVSAVTVDITCEDSETRAEFGDTTKTDAWGRYRLGSPMGTVSYLGINGKRVDGPMPQLTLGENTADYLLKTIAGKDRAVPAAPPVEGAGFGPVIERVLRSGPEAASVFIDLDSGKLIAPPGELDLSDVGKVERWAKQSGADARLAIAERGRGLRFFETFAGYMTGDSAKAEWDSITADRLRQQIADAQWGMVRFGAEDIRPREGRSPKALNATYTVEADDLAMSIKFQTRDGGTGILQILGFTDKPKGVQIRYKLVQRDKSAAARIAQQRAEAVKRRAEAVKRRAEAAKEDPGVLLRQLDAGELSDEKIRQITDKVLAIQGDLKQPWDGAWGNWLETARVMGKVSDADFTRYAKHSNPTWKLLALQITREDGKLGLSFGITHFGGRVASATSDHNLIIKHRLVRLRLGDVELDPGNTGGEWSFAANTQHGFGLFREKSEIDALETLKPGKYEAVAELEATIYEAGKPDTTLHRLRTQVKDELKLTPLLLGSAARPGASEAAAGDADNEAWGKPVQGVQCRLEADKPTWKAVETPTLKVYVRHQTDTRLFLSNHPSFGAKLELDGHWHRWSGPLEWAGPAHSSSKLRTKDEHPLKITLDENWKQVDNQEPLRLDPGRHVVRFAWEGHPERGPREGPDEQRDFVLISNPVEIKILPEAPEPKPGETAFGPVMERMLSFNSMEDAAHLDLDTGKHGRNQPGKDLIAAAGESDLRVRSGLDMVAIPVDPSRWNASPDEILAEVAKAEPQRHVRLGGPESRRTVFFETREGGVGVLRIVPMRDEQGNVKVRYKMSLGNGKQTTWGPAVEGVQVRLRADKKTWKSGTLPSLTADVRNRGTRDLYIAQHQALCELQVDGNWYQWAGGAIDVKSSPLSPGRRYGGIPVTLVSSWHSKEANRPLEVTIGKHTVRVAFIPDPMEKDGKPVRAVSNPVEIEIVAEESAAGGEKTA